MQNYVQFLKSSYANVFGESALLGSPSRSRSSPWGQCSPCTSASKHKRRPISKPYDVQKIGWHFRVIIRRSLLFFLQHETIKWWWHISVGYQQYRFGVGGWRYTISCALKPDGFAYGGKGPFHPVRSWWFQLSTPVSGLLSILMFMRVLFLFMLLFSFCFCVGEIMWGFLFVRFFYIFFKLLNIVLIHWMIGWWERVHPPEVWSWK